MYDSIIIGCGFAGAVAARKLAEEKNKKVLILEQREHIGGNCYDTEDEYGILIHQYGPHIFHTNERIVYEYLSRFTKWHEYSHEVVGAVDEKMIPIPFNLNTLYLVYGEEKGKILEEKLINTYGMGARVPILQLKDNEDKEISKIADYVYEKIFLKYTMKQWGKKPEEIDCSVTARVPILISYDNRYFQDHYQGIPLHGYTALFEQLLNHKNITVELNTNAKEVLSFDKKMVFYKEQPFLGEVIYTGAIDELFDCKYGRLPYRSLKFVSEHYEKDSYQQYAVVNYTVSQDYTRISEYKKITGQNKPNSTTIMKEYPISYSGTKGEIPYYSIVNKENMELYNNYKEIIQEIGNFYLLGRLAEYKYYNIDAIVKKALLLVDTL